MNGDSDGDGNGDGNGDVDGSSLARESGSGLGNAGQDDDRTRKCKCSASVSVSCAFLQQPGWLVGCCTKAGPGTPGTPGNYSLSGLLGRSIWAVALAAPRTTPNDPNILFGGVEWTSAPSLLR